MTKNNKIILFSVIAILTALTVCVTLIISHNKRQEYTVTFMTEGTIYKEVIVTEGNYLTKPSDPVKPGYDFIEWQYNGRIFNFGTSIESNIVLKAKWEKKKENVETIIVKFDSDGGTTYPNEIIEKGKKVEKPKEPIKEGYTFKYWTVDNKEYNFDTLLNKDTTIKAVWEKVEEKKEEKNTKSNNSSNSSNSTTTNNNSSNSSNGTTTNNNSSSNNTNNNNSNASTPQDNTTKQYTVSFNTNGGSSVTNQIIESGKTASMPNNPTKSGYDFIEWQLNGTTYNFSNPVNSNITLVAIWKNQVWDIDSSTGAIVKYKGNDTIVNIPTTIDGVAISKINSNAFSSSSIESLTIPSSINKIEGSAFLKTSNPQLTEVYVKDNLWKNTNWSAVFGTVSSAYATGDSGILIKGVYKLNYCDMGVFSGTCATGRFVHIINSDGIYPVYYDATECWKSNGGTGILFQEIPYYVTSDSFTLHRLGYSNFEGWIGDNGNTPEKEIIIPTGSTGAKHYTAVCSS